MEKSMSLTDAIGARHSVRAYKDIPIPEEIRKQLDDFAEACSREGNLHILSGTMMLRVFILVWLITEAFEMLRIILFSPV